MSDLPPGFDESDIPGFDDLPPVKAFNNRPLTGSTIATRPVPIVPQASSSAQPVSSSFAQPQTNNNNNNNSQQPSLMMMPHQQQQQIRFGNAPQQAQQQMQPMMMMQQQQQPQQQQRSCYRCGQEGHFSRDCPLVGGSGVTARPMTTCFKCGQPGHKSAQCPLMAVPQQQQGNNNNGPGMPMMPMMPMMMMMPGGAPAQQPTTRPSEAETNTVYIGSVIDVQNNEPFIRSVFDKYGEIPKIQIHVQKRIAFVHFRNQEDAVRARNEVEASRAFGNSKISYGRMYEFNESEDNRQQQQHHQQQQQAEEIRFNSPPSTILFVGNVPDRISDQAIVSHFDCYPGFQRMSRNNSKMVAFCHFDSVENATAAIVATRGKTLDGVHVKIDYGKERTDNERRRDHHHQYGGSGDAAQQQAHSAPQESGARRSRSPAGGSGPNIVPPTPTNLTPQQQQLLRSTQQLANKSDPAASSSTTGSGSGSGSGNNHKDHHSGALTLLPTEAASAAAAEKKAAALPKPAYMTRNRADPQMVIALENKVAALTSSSYYACGLVPPLLLVPPAVAGILALVDDVDESVVELTSANLHNSTSKKSQASAAGHLVLELEDALGHKCLAHAFAAIAKRLKEYYDSDTIKRLCVFYLAAAVLFKRTGNTPSWDGAMEQFAMLTSVVAAGQDEAATGHMQRVVDALMSTCVKSKSDEVSVEICFSILAGKRAAKDVSSLLKKLKSK